MEKPIQSIIGQGKVNQLGGHYINGRPLNNFVRHAIVSMYKNGEKPCNISRSLKVSHGAVSKILNRYNETGSVHPGQIGGTARTRKTVVQFEKEIRAMKESNPDIHAKEIRQTLIKIGKCTKENAPTESSIARRLTAYKRAKVAQKKENVLPIVKNDDEKLCQILASSNVKIINHSIDNILSSPHTSTLNENNSSTVSSVSTNEDSWTDDDDNSISNRSLNNENRRNRTAFTSEQIKILEQKFEQKPYPDEQEKQDIIDATGLDLNRINTWFSNRRARFRKSCGYSANSSEILPQISIPTTRPPINFVESFLNVPQPRPNLNFLSSSILQNPSFPNFQFPLFNLNNFLLYQKLHQK